MHLAQSPIELIDSRLLSNLLEIHFPSADQASLVNEINKHFHKLKHGDLPRWVNSLQNLPDLHTLPKFSTSFSEAAITVVFDESLNPQQESVIEECLRGLMPWRKGPFKVGNINIDTEWRSNLKWERLQQAITPLSNRKILDVGCGNGYYLWRIRADRPALSVGIDPSLLFLVQFCAINHFIHDELTIVLPLGIEQLPEKINRFDTVFSMGVLYHRRDASEHLRQLQACLRPGGELVLETLIVDEAYAPGLSIDGRYANMRNIWYLPTVKTLEKWLLRENFHHIRCIDVSRTTVTEQRPTDWMPFHSLPEALHPTNKGFTIEGLPAPKRALMVANRI